MKKMIVAMGLYAFAFSASAEPLILDMVHHNPGEKMYDSVFNDPAVVKQAGFNGKVYFLFDSPTLAINWESVDPSILPRGCRDRKWVDAKAARIRSLQADCTAQGIEVYAMADLILFPKRLVEKYEMGQTLGNPNNPLTEKFLRAQMNEIFDQFPDTDGLVVRIGETYLQDAPFHMGHIEKKSNADKTIIPLIQILRDEVCVKRNKKIIFRTWRAFDIDARSYLKVSNGVEPHPNLTISIKHCEKDFHRANPFSKVIGLGRHRQIIEVQCAREYEGKGAYPHYVLNGVIEGFEEHERMPVEQIRSLREWVEQRPDLYGGMWTWSRGGGWTGPFIKNEMWCDLNAWVAAQWAADPTQSEASVYNRYATERLHLNAKDLPAFRQIGLLSAQAVVRGINTTHHDSEWWTRDQEITWPMVISEEPGARERNVNQKDEAIACWKQMVQLAESIDWPDAELENHVIGSIQYGLRLYEIYRAVINLEQAEFADDRAAMKKWLPIYDEAWASYKKLPEDFDGIAMPLYHMTGLGKRHIQVLRQKLLMAYPELTDAAGLPNILFIFLDDLGYGDTRCYNPNSKIQTPNIDRLARQGMQFTDVHAAAAICGPSRYALMSGRYPWRRGPGGTGNGEKFQDVFFEAGCTTIASLLKDKGYSTAQMGKWGIRHNYSDAKWATKKPGFSNSYNFKRNLLLGSQTVGFDYAWYMTHLFPKPGMTKIDVYTKHQFENGLPVDMNLSHFSDPYSWLPSSAKKVVEYLETFAGKRENDAFLVNRQAPFLIYFDPPAPHEPIVTQQAFVGKSAAGAYGDYVTEVDHYVGEILDTLDRLDLTKDTLVVLSSDNGPENTCYARAKQFRHYSMGNLRGVKRDTWEAGHHVPMLVRWPGVVEPGSRSDELVCLTDWYATIAEVARHTPSGLGGEDSVSILPILKGQEMTVRESMIHHTNNGIFAIRHGDWVFIDGKSGDAVGAEPDWFVQERGAVAHNFPGELYNLNDDPQQTRNLYGKYPEKVQELKAMMVAFDLPEMKPRTPRTKKK